MMEQYNWERDVRMRRWQRSQDGPTPYSEVRTWRRRFYAVLALFRRVPVGARGRNNLAPKRPHLHHLME